MLRLPSLPCRRRAASSFVPMLLVLLVLLASSLQGAWAAGPAPLELGRASVRVDAWPAVTLLADEGARLDARAALAAADRFAPPALANGVLPISREPSWMRIPFRIAPDAPGDWVVQIDFGILDHVEFYLEESGALRKLASSGRRLEETGALKGRVPATALSLRPGGEYTLLVRVQANGPRVAPVSFMQPDAFHRASLAEQMLQGVLLGIAACLVAYSLGQWFTMRNALYLKYAMYVGGLTMYSIVWFGLGEQFLWRGSEWISRHMMGLSSMIASSGAYLFVEQVLARPGRDRRFSRIMRTGAAACALVGVLWCLDLIDHRIMIGFTVTVGSAPMFLGLPGAWRRVRDRDPIGAYFMLSWFFSAGGAVVQSLMVAGKLPANFWTLHSLELGVTVDMLMFLRMLGLRGKAMEVAMLRAEAEARMKSEFLANMSHEIRTPMNAIINMSRLALMGEAPPRLRNYLSKILGAGEHLLGLVNDILDHAKMEAGKLVLEQQAFELNSLFDHLASVNSEKCDAKGVELVFRIGPDVPQRLVGDPLRLGQVLVNLAGNAAKFTERGEIVVAVDLVERLDDGVVLEFSVTDTGIGMTPEQVGRLFQSFTQADSSTTRKYGGTGLGLSISRQLVELMGGGISATSTAGAGSRFRFTVPLALDGAEAVDGAEAAAAPRLAPLPDLRALVVDDSAAARAALADMLAALGVRADTAASGDEGLAALARARAAGQSYGVVLVDYHMPHVDGVETIRRMAQAAPRDAPPAVLMLPACARDTVREQQGDAPVAAFLHKPVGPELLYHSMLQALHPHSEMPEPPGAAMASMADLPRLDGARILLAEDNANNREVALDFLAAARMQVDVAVDGREAVRMVMAGDYDLVLMDVQMPELDGLDATRALRRDARLRELPIVAMTAHALPSDRARSLAAGMSDHITKPFDPDLLFSTLLKWIDPARLQGRAPPPRPAQRGAAAEGMADILGGLPAVPGLDWRLALEKVDGQRSRLEKRASSFVREYADAPRILREALGNGNHLRLQSLAHNLKASAAYVGAYELSAAAQRLEQDLRNDQAERLAAQMPGLVRAAETVLAALSTLVEATPAGLAIPAEPARPPAPPRLAPLLARLQAYLLTDDARANDALAELQVLLGDSRHAAALGDLWGPVLELEYAAALPPLAALASALDIDLEDVA